MMGEQVLSSLLRCDMVCAGDGSDEPVCFP